MAHYQSSGEALWATEFLQDHGSNANFLANIKIVQSLHKEKTVYQSTLLCFEGLVTV